MENRLAREARLLAVLHQQVKEQEQRVQALEVQRLLMVNPQAELMQFPEAEPSPTPLPVLPPQPSRDQQMEQVLYPETDRLNPLRAQPDLQEIDRLLGLSPQPTSPQPSET
jgi:hypothetical protein